MGNLTVDEVREETSKLEKDLTALVKAFYTKTSMVVESVDVLRLEDGNEVIDYLLRVDIKF